MLERVRCDECGKLPYCHTSLIPGSPWTSATVVMVISKSNKKTPESVRQCGGYRRKIRT